MVRRVITISFAGTCSLVQPEEGGVLNGPIHGIAGVDAFNIPALIRALTDTGEEPTPESTQFSVGFHGPGSHSSRSGVFAQASLMRGAVDGFYGDHNVSETSDNAMAQLLTLFEGLGEDDTVTLNLVGWSRGAVAVNMLLSKLKEFMAFEAQTDERLSAIRDMLRDKLKEVNVHGIDPVVGGPIDRYGQASAQKILENAQSKLQKAEKACYLARSKLDAHLLLADGGVVGFSEPRWIAERERLIEQARKKEKALRKAQEKLQEVVNMLNGYNIYEDIEELPSSTGSIKVRTSFFHSMSGNLGLWEMFRLSTIANIPFFSGLLKRKGEHYLMPGNHERMALCRDKAFEGLTPEEMRSPDYPKEVLNRLLYGGSSREGSFPVREFSSGRLSGVITLLKTMSDLEKTGALVKEKLPEPLREQGAIETKLQEALDAYRSRVHRTSYKRMFHTQGAPWRGRLAEHSDFVLVAKGSGPLPEYPDFNEEDRHTAQQEAALEGATSTPTTSSFMARMMRAVSRSRL